MKYLLITLVVLSAAYGCTTSRPAANEPVTGSADSDPVLEKSLLWEITGNGLSQPSYLFGTIHMICKEDFFLTDVMKKAVADSREVYLELDMDDPSMTMKTMQLSLMKGKTLRDVFTPTDYALLEKFMKDSIGMSLSMLNGVKPFTVYSLLALRELPCRNPESYEQAFIGLAKQQGKEVKGLERLEDQFAVFDQIPDEKEAEMIMSTVKNFNQHRQDFARMIASYRQQDISGLFQQMRSSPEMLEFEDLLLAKRNRNWIPVMEEAMKQGGIFFAVGAGHLPGREGVIQLLKQKGYEVRPRF